MKKKRAAAAPETLEHSKRPDSQPVAPAHWLVYFTRALSSQRHTNILRTR